MEGEPCEIFVMLSVDEAPESLLHAELDRTRAELRRVCGERDTWLDAACRLNAEHIKDQAALQHYRDVLSGLTEQHREDTARLGKELETTRRRLKEVASLLDQDQYQRAAKVTARDRLSRRE